MSPVPQQVPEIGTGWLRKGQTSGEEYVALSIAAPEFGAKIYHTSAERPAYPTLTFTGSSGAREIEHTSPRADSGAGALILFLLPATHPSSY